MTDRGDLERWLRDYRRAWERADPDAAAALFSEDARFRSAPLRPVHRGPDGIRDYWAGATSDQAETEVRWGGPVIEGSRVAVEWWANLVLMDGMESTVAGVLVLTFDGEGQCADLREYWNQAEGRMAPPEGWGEVGMSTGPDSSIPARRWADGYERAWRTADADAAAAMYGEDVVYRSHPFRDPHRGREGVLVYTRENFGVETGQDPRFGRPVASGMSAAVEYWVPMVEEGKEATLMGCALLRFVDDGLVGESREYWFMEPGLHQPYEGWGM